MPPKTAQHIKNCISNRDDDLTKTYKADRPTMSTQLHIDRSTGLIHIIWITMAIKHIDNAASRLRMLIWHFRFDSLTVRAINDILRKNNP